MLAMLPSLFRRTELRDLETIKKIVRLSYPSVTQASTSTLAEWMRSDVSLQLIDVRSTKEFAVSHLSGAINLKSAQDISRAINKQKPSKTVLYCSVGFRSSRLANVLARDGIADVANLEGSIFQWANEGRAVYQGDVPVEKVHPFGKRWAGLLKPGLASEC